MKNWDLSGKTALVTGASRGIGKAAAYAFAAAGANVVLVARSETEIAQTAADIGAAACAVQADVSDYDQVAAAVATAIAQFGSLDIFVGNAGVIDPIGPLATSKPDAWGKAIDINLKGVHYGMRAALPGMLAQGHGTIITTSSGAAHGPVEGWSAYCSGKAGAFMLTRVADHENRDKGIRIMGLSPGTVATEMQREIKKSGINPVSKLDWSDHVPPEWPAQALVWMCTSEADEYLGTDVMLRDDAVRRKVGLM